MVKDPIRSAQMPFSLPTSQATKAFPVDLRVDVIAFVLKTNEYYRWASDRNYRQYNGRGIRPERYAFGDMAFQ